MIVKKNAAGRKVTKLYKLSPGMCFEHKGVIHLVIEVEGDYAHVTLSGGRLNKDLEPETPVYHVSCTANWEYM